MIRGGSTGKVALSKARSGYCKPSFVIALLLLSAFRGTAQRPKLVVQTGHTGSINSVAFSPDGKLVATGSADSTVKLWDVETGIQVASLPSHFDSVVTFAPNGQLLATGDSEGLIKLWSVVSGTELRSFKIGEFAINSIAFSPNGKLLASGTLNGTKVLDVVTGALLASLDREANSVAFSRDGRILAIGGGLSDPTIRLWDVENGKLLRTLPGHTDTIYSIAFSPDHRIFASGCRDGTIRLWDIASGRQISVLAQEVINLRSIAFSPDGKKLASGGGNITIWDLTRGKALRTMGKKYDNYFSIAFSPDGKTLAGGGDASRSEDVKMWDVATGKHVKSLAAHATWTQSIAFSPDGKLLASGSYNSTIKVWGLSGKSPFGSIVGHAYWVESVAFSPDGKLLASGSHDNTIKLWDVASGKPVKSLEGGYWVKSVAFNPNGTLLATVSHEPGIKLWDVTSGSLVRLFKDGVEEFFSVAFSPNGTLLAAGGRGSTILWDLPNGTKYRALESNGEDMTSVAFSPDGKLLAGAGERNNTIAIWDVHSGSQLRSLRGHAAPVNSVAFSPDGKMLASASSDFSVRLWDVRTGAQLKSFNGHANLVTSVAFSPDGKVIASGSFDGTIKLWQVDRDNEVATLISLDKDDWVVVTPDGLFDGSPSGWNNIIWRFNNNILNFAPVEGFFVDFFHPGLLTDIFAGRHPTAASDISQKDRRPAHVKLTQSGKHAGTGKSTERYVTVNVEILQAPAGAQDVRLFRNGSLIKVWHGDVLKEQNAVTLETQIPLVAGENKLTAYAFNRDNIKSSDASLLISGSDSLQRVGKLYILTIGIDKYVSAGYDLRFAVADVDEMSRHLAIEQARLGNYAETVLISLLDEQAAKANVILALRRFADDSLPLPPNLSSGLKRQMERIRRAEPEDALLIYFAGHGTARDQHFYLLPHDFIATSDERLKESSVSDIELNELLEAVGAGKLLMVIDACQSGQVLGGEKEGRGPMNSKGLAQLAYDKGMYVLAAAQSYQAAKEVSRTLAGQKIEHGLLTFSLLAGFSKARADDEGQISEREWMNYAEQQVPVMQFEEMRKRNVENRKAGGNGQRGVELVFATGDDESIEPDKRNVQSPRIFYRPELKAHPFIVAKQLER